MIDSLVCLKKNKIAVIGDFMLDSYTKGSVKRISPEAPVCVLKVKKQERLPGGAGNVALNCHALGSQVYAIGRIGDDFASSYLKSDLERLGIVTEGLIFEQEFETPLKNRFMAEHQQLLRVDFEKDQPLLPQTQQAVIEYLAAHMPLFDLVLISDYNKGFLTRELLGAVIELAKAHDVPIFVDPKGCDFTKYLGVTLIKPNLHEAYLASNLDEKATLDDVARVLIEKSGVESLLITRSEQGMSLFSQGQRVDFKACAKEVIDVTGAGDTVLATLAVTYASGIELSTCIEWANIAASCAIEKLGCVHVGIKELVTALSKNDIRFKYVLNLSFELFSLFLNHQKLLMIPVDDKGLNFLFLSELAQHKKQNPEHLLVAVVADDAKQEFISSLCELTLLDFVIPKSLEGVANQEVLTS